MKALTTFSLLILSTSLQAQPVSVTIHNDSVSSIYSAKIRLSSGNDWTELGVVKPGDNTFYTDVDVDDYTGSLWVEKSEMEKWVTHFNKIKDIESIDLNLKINEAVSADKDVPNGVVTYVLDSYKAGYDEKQIAGKSLDATLYKLPAEAKNAWSANCDYASFTGVGELLCGIKSSPSIVFQSGIATGIMLPDMAVFYGNFSSSLSPSDIKGQQSGFVMAAVAAYAKIQFEKGSLGTFEGGGVGLGDVIGMGMFY